MKGFPLCSYFLRVEDAFTFVSIFMQLAASCVIPEYLNKRNDITRKLEKDKSGVSIGMELRSPNEGQTTPPGLGTATLAAQTTHPIPKTMTAISSMTALPIPMYLLAVLMMPGYG